jgi:hypothetical protein
VKSFKEWRWFLKSTPEAVNGIPRYVYCFTTGRGSSHNEIERSGEERGRITPHFGRLTEMPLRTLQGREKKQNVISEEKARL